MPSKAPHRVWRRLRAGCDPYLILVLLLALFPIAPLLQPGYFWDAHDARHSVYFLYELDRGIQDGILFPRWQPDFAFGYGYPFFNIYGPLSSYLGEAFHLLGFGFADSVKIVFGLSVVASGLAMYGFVRQALGRRAGLVAAVAYMVIPYRLVDIYVRAALAEAVAYVFVPLVLWGAWAAIRRPRLASVLGLALAFAALVLTHPLTALLLTVVLVFYTAVLALARVNESQPFRALTRESILPLLGHLGHVLAPVVGGVVLGLGLSALFVVPAMTESRFVRVDQWYGGRYSWGGDFVEFFQLFSPQWGFGTSVPGPDDGMSFQLGAVPVVLAVIAVVGLGCRDRARPASPLQPVERGARRLIGFFAALAAVLVFLMLGVSAPVWQALPLARLAQFPWRLLALAVVALSFLCGAVFWRYRPESWHPGHAATLLAALLVLGSLPYMRAEMSERDVSLAALYQFQQSSDEMTGSTAWVETIPRWSPMAELVVRGKKILSKIDYGLLYEQPGVEAQTLELRTDRELVEYLAPEGALITFDTFYYPGWRAYLMDPETNETVRELPIAQRGELGLMTVEVPAGIWRVLLRFEDTPLRKASKVVSWLTVGLCVALIALRAVLRSGRGVQRDEPVESECAEGAGRKEELPARAPDREGR
jgi:ABC-type polysaccharide/polyol phosphate export permease